MYNLTVFSVFTEFDHHHNQFKHYHHPTKKSCIHEQPLLIFPLSLPCPSPRQPLIYILFPVCLLWTFQINGIINFVVFSGLLSLKMFSRFISIVTCIYNPFLFIAIVWIYLMLFTHQLMDIWVL